MAQPNVMPASAPLPRFREAYQSLLAEMGALPNDELTNVNLDIHTAVTTVLGLLPKIRGLRSQITASFRDFDIVQFDKLEAYGRGPSSCARSRPRRVQAAG